MEKIVSLLAILLLTLSLFGCGNNDERQYKSEYAMALSEKISNCKTLNEYEDGVNFNDIDTVQIGNYYKDSYDEKEPVDWIVLEKDAKNNRALLISKNILDKYKYKKKKEVEWKNSKIRDRLNNYLYNEFFNNDEKQLIQDTINKNCAGNFQNQQFNELINYDDTTDKLFCLSVKEFEKYFNIKNTNDSDMDNEDDENNENSKIRTNKLIRTISTLHVNKETKQYDEIKKLLENNKDNYMEFVYSYTLRDNSVSSYPIGHVVPTPYRYEVYTGAANGVQSPGGRFTYEPEIINCYDDFVSDYIRPALRIYCNDDIKTQILNSKKVCEYSQDDDIEMVDSIKFGKYYISDDTKKEDIEWVVLDYDTENNIATLLSKYIIDKFEEPIEKSISNWENSDIRLWMNNDFYNELFNNDEKTAILTSNIKNLSNPLYNEADNQNTDDKMFNLSIYEYNRTMSKSIKKYKSNKYCKTTNFWLRTNGNVNTKALKGTIHSNNVNYNGTSNSSVGGIRPAMYVYFSDKSNGASNGFIGDYYYIDGVKQLNCWVDNNSKYLDENGYVKRNCWQDGYYLDGFGEKIKDANTPDGNKVDKDGKIINLEEDLKKSVENNEIKPDTWYRTESDVWYYFENDRKTKKIGWFTDPNDNQTYYLNPNTGIMATGWTKIDGNTYYFNAEHSNEPNWYYVAENDTWDSLGKNIKSYGSMYKNEETPDGNKVDENGRLIDNENE